MAVAKARGGREAGARPWASSAVGDTLRAARLRAALSQVELASRLGVSQETVSAAELGRPPRRTTLMAYLQALPGLAPHDFLPQPGVPVPASPAAWARLRDVFGFSARLCRAEFRQDSRGRLRRVLRVEGVASGELPYSNLLGEALARAVAWVADETLEKIAFSSQCSPTRSRPLVVADSRGEHRFWTARDGAKVAVFYELRGLAEDGQGDGREDGVQPSLALDYVAERLELVVQAPKGMKPLRATPWVRPETIPLEDVRPDLARLMYPACGPPRIDAGRITWTVKRPLPGFEYGLDVGRGEALLTRPRRSTLADTLRTARQAAGLTLRDVAARANVCHASVAQAEGDRDPRLGTLVGYLQAIPSLSPQELLPAICDTGSLSDAETWSLYRDIYGYEIRELRKSLTIHPDGSSTNVIETLGLRPLRDDLRDMRVRTGLHRAVAQASEAVLQEVQSDLEELRIRRIHKVDAGVMHEFSFPTRLASGSLSHVRRYSGGKFPLRNRDSKRPRTEMDDLYSGAALPAFHPVKRAILQVVLPGGFEPRWVRAFAWPACITPSRDLPALSAELSSPPCRVVSTSTECRISVEIERPLIGTSLALTWGVPD